MDTFRQDLLFAFRMLRKDRAYAAAVILTLAICLGANTAIFTVVRSVLLRPLPYPQSERLAFMFDGFPGAGVERAGTSVPNYLDRVPLSDVFDSVALFQNGGFRVGQGAGAEGVASMTVTPVVLPRAPHQGGSRALLHAKTKARPARTRSSCSARRLRPVSPEGSMVSSGDQLRLNDEPYVVVGVAPDDVHLPRSRYSDVGAARLHSGAARRRQPLQPEPRFDCAARRERDASARAGTARRARTSPTSNGPALSRAR